MFFGLWVSIPLIMFFGLWVSIYVVRQCSRTYLCLHVLVEFLPRRHKCGLSVIIPSTMEVH